jgi:hypothetical protein
MSQLWKKSRFGSTDSLARDTMEKPPTKLFRESHQAVGRQSARMETDNASDTDNEMLSQKAPKTPIPPEQSIEPPIPASKQSWKSKELGGRTPPRPGSPSDLYSPTPTRIKAPSFAPLSQLGTPRKLHSDHTCRFLSTVLSRNKRTSHKGHSQWVARDLQSLPLVSPL